MSIEIELDETAIAAGSCITGSVVVRPDRDMTCHVLSMALITEIAGPIRPEVLLDERPVRTDLDWRAGETYRYTLEIPVPIGPADYDGTLFRIGHRIRIEADIPFTENLIAETPIRVMPGAMPAREDPDLLYAIRPDFFKRTLPILAVILAVVLGFVARPFLTPLLPAQTYLWFAVIVVLAFTALVMTLVRDDIAEIRLGRARFTIVDRVLRPGDEVIASIHITPKPRVRITALTFALEGRERVADERGRRLRSHVFHRDAEVIPIERNVGRAEYRARFTLPPTNAFSYSSPSGDHQIQWTVHVAVDLPRWPDWAREQRIMVVLSGTG